MLFAEDVLERNVLVPRGKTASGKTAAQLIHEYGQYLCLGAQGPDLFFHNRRTEPSGLLYGNLLHLHHYGRAAAAMADRLSACAPAADKETGPEKNTVSVRHAGTAFLIGFISHAFLDRAAHPFINYFSGIYDTGHPEFGRYRRAHPFFERIIDTLLLQEKRELRAADFDFFSAVFCGERIPTLIEDMLSSALRRTYPKAAGDPDLQVKIANAYGDSMRYYRWSNMPGADLYRKALKRETEGANAAEWLALVPPLELPEGIDFLNTSRRSWTDPADNDRVYNSSFYDLYSKAIEDCSAAAAELTDLAVGKSAGKQALTRLEQAVGNENLNDGRKVGRSFRKRYSDPFPLPDILDELYRKIKTRFGPAE